MRQRISRILSIVILTFLNVNLANAQNNETIDYDRLIDAIALVESSHNPNAVSKDGTCVGYLQMKTVCVRECNNILKARKSSVRYTYADRYDKQKSIEMFMIIQSKYNPNGDLIHGIRLWNEGPFYKRNKPITSYVKKVLRIYNKKSE